MMVQNLVGESEKSELKVGNVEVIEHETPEVDKVVVENAVIFDNDLAVVYHDEEWYIIDRLMGDFLNNAGFHDSELELMALTLIYMAQYGRTDDGIFGIREFLRANTDASDFMRSSAILSEKHLTIIQDFVTLARNLSNSHQLESQM